MKHALATTGVEGRFESCTNHNPAACYHKLSPTLRRSIQLAFIRTRVQYEPRPHSRFVAFSFAATPDNHNAPATERRTVNEQNAQEIVTIESSHRSIVADGRDRKSTRLN